MSPLNRVRIPAVVAATIVAIAGTLWIKEALGVGFSPWLWLPFAFFWFPVAGGMMIGVTVHESLRSKK